MQPVQEPERSSFQRILDADETQEYQPLTHAQLEHAPASRITKKRARHVESQIRHTENNALKDARRGYPIEQPGPDAAYWRELETGVRRVCSNPDHKGDYPPATDEFFYTSDNKKSRFNPEGFHSWCKDCERNRMRIQRQRVQRKSRYRRKLAQTAG